MRRFTNLLKWNDVTSTYNELGCRGSASVGTIRHLFSSSAELFDGGDGVHIFQLDRRPRNLRENPSVAPPEHR